LFVAILIGDSSEDLPSGAASRSFSGVGKILKPSHGELVLNQVFSPK